MEAAKTFDLQPEQLAAGLMGRKSQRDAAGKTAERRLAADGAQPGPQNDFEGGPAKTTVLKRSQQIGARDLGAPEPTLPDTGDEPESVEAPSFCSGLLSNVEYHMQHCQTLYITCNIACLALGSILQQEPAVLLKASVALG